MKIGKELAKMAKKSGICEEWYHSMVDTNDKDHLLQMYLDGIDFCLSNNYPSNDYIRANFKGIMEKYGIFLDDKIDVIDQKKVVALGASSGMVQLGEYTISQIFIKHDSSIDVVVRDHAFAMIDIFDNAKVNIIAGENSRVCVNRYLGASVDFEQHGNAYVKVVDKPTKTYENGNNMADR